MSAVGTLRFGIAPAVWDTTTEARLSAFCAALASATGLVVTPFATGDYRGILDAIERGEVDAAWLPPVAALRGTAHGALIPLALPLRQGVSTFSAVLFTKRADRFRELADVHDATVAWVDRHSAAGYVVVRAHLALAGIDLRTAFTFEQFCGSHPKVVQAVVSGTADLGATYASFDDEGRLVSSSWLSAGHSTGLHVVAAAGPIPADVIAMSMRTPVAHGRLLQRALLSEGPGSPLGRAARTLFQADGFEIPRPEHLRPLARLLDGLGEGTRFNSAFPPRP
jgi:phosphonate transport system substrate-binding protein